MNMNKHNSNTQIFTVVVKPISQERELHDSDINVPGEYDIQLIEEVDSRLTGKAALDILHETVPIKLIENYEFTAYGASCASIIDDEASELVLFDKGHVIERRELY